MISRLYRCSLRSRLSYSNWLKANRLKRLWVFFSRMSTNYSADLKTRVEPCVLGGTPDCNQCGCIASVGLHSVDSVKAAGPLKVNDLVRASMVVGRWIAKHSDLNNCA